MPERKKYPLHKALKEWPLHPVIIIKGGTACQALADMITDLCNDPFIISYQYDFMLVSETSVIKIWRTKSKSFVINEHKLGMQVTWKIKTEIYPILMKHTQIPAADNINKMHIRMPGSDYCNIDSSLNSI